MRRLKGIVFDLDGTLIDSAPDLHNALDATLKAHGRRSVSRDEFETFYGDGMRILVKRAFAATGEPYPDSETEKYFQEYVYNYRRQTPDPMQVFPGAVEMLEALLREDIKLGICTLKPEEPTLWLLEELGLRRFFASIGGGDTFKVAKPNPGHLLSVIERFGGISAADCVMIGDGPKDVAMARAAGIPCFLVDHGRAIGPTPPEADGLLRGFKDFRQALERGLKALAIEQLPNILR